MGPVLWRYTLPLTAPLSLAGGLRLPARQGLVLAETDDDGQIRAAAEAAPLPGFSQESVDDAADMLLSALSDSGDWPATAEHPSLQWALACLHDGTLHRATGAACDKVPGRNTNAVGIRTAGYGRSSDTTVTKIKLGPDPLTNAERVKAALAGGARLRLDANRQLSHRDALSLLAALPRQQVDGVEEPCPTLRDSLWVCRRAGLPLWLDETTREHTPAGLLEALGALKSGPEAVGAVVLKPMLLGDKLNVWLDAARAHGWRVIISSTYESPLGLAALQRLAGQVAPEDVHGLDTGHLFEAGHWAWPPVPGAVWQRLWPA
ncbi:MAG: hypothetical protein D6758_07760 [Gammaproteobacteria bacterium]|nr:MAG: hypothetical protein D6758_07760 [Gammaproteobacteria bacterium]